MTRLSSIVVTVLTRRFPELRSNLLQAGLPYTPEQFVKKTMLSAFYFTVLLEFIILMVFSKAPFLKLLMGMSTPFLLVFCFLYFLQLPVVKQHLKAKDVEKEIVYAARFLIIELQSGVSLYNSFLNLVHNYPYAGKYIKRIVEAVDLGSDMELAIDEAADACPSVSLTKILVQIKNSLSSGSDVTASLVEINHQITKEQIIAVKEYGRKLNPFVMFFMMVAVIMPSLGVTAFIVFASFLSVSVQLPILMVFVAGLGFIQFMFLNMIKSSRPPVEYD